MKLVIAEKPSVALSIAKVLGANDKKMVMWRGMDIKFPGVLGI